jgi:hypothetical protein
MDATRAAAVLLALAACHGDAARCADLCDRLTGDCAYAAYPDPASCEQGCRYDVSTGADVDALFGCVVAADCDTPTVLACARAYGGAP